MSDEGRTRGGGAGRWVPIWSPRRALGQVFQSEDLRACGLASSRLCAFQESRAVAYSMGSAWKTQSRAARGRGVRHGELGRGRARERGPVNVAVWPRACERRPADAEAADTMTRSSRGSTRPSSSRSGGKRRRRRRLRMRRCTIGRIWVSEGAGTVGEREQERGRVSVGPWIGSGRRVLCRWSRGVWAGAPDRGSGGF
jgi:hypothetical protein